MKEKVETYRTKIDSPTQTRVPCYRTSFVQPFSFAVYVEASSTRDGPTGRKTGTIVLVDTKVTTKKEKQTLRKKHDIWFLNSHRNATSVDRETLFPVVYTPKQGCIDLRMENGSPVKAKNASIHLDHDFRLGYDVAFDTQKESTAPNAVAGFESLYLQVTAPFEVYTSSEDGILVKGVVLTLDSTTARIMLPANLNFVCSTGESKLQNSRFYNFCSELFDVPIDSFLKRFIPVKKKIIWLMCIFHS